MTATRPALVPASTGRATFGFMEGEKWNRIGKLGRWRRLFCVLLVCAAAPIASTAQTFTTLVSFKGPNGIFPESIVQGLDGNLWGTTANGGISNCGTVFKMQPKGILTRFVTFNCTKVNTGQGIILGTDGDFYGITFWGAGNEGTVFKLKPGNPLAVLANFDGTHGSEPVGSLAEGNDGSFYGATYSGGSDDWGTVFKVTPTGTLTTVYDFDFTNGAQPYAGLVQGVDGNFYGTTYSGGHAGCGTVFKVSPKGALTVLHSLDCTSDGGRSIASLAPGRDGNFYGVANSGGVKNDGTVFKITPSGVFTTLYSFSGTDGQFPAGALVQSTDGNFYGTTAAGGAQGSGTVFRMTPAGVVTTLHSFDGTDGEGPFDLVEDTDGTLYGITGNGGTWGNGTVFSLAVGLGPFVKTLPTLGKVGTNVIILGTNLTGASGVTFNGIAATFAVVSSSEITTTVPSGATTGVVHVTIPSRTLSSNVHFRVVN